MAEEVIVEEFNPDVKRGDFPHNFMFGVGTAAYQVEGAWNACGKGLSIWDTFALRNPGKISDGSNACVTVDNYSRMKEDVQLLKKMGVNYYRFSISWSRILPGGKVGMGKNVEGINYYNRLIDELKANHIEPFVSLFHWDLPNALEQEYMGFLSPLIVDDFKNYAEVCFWEFGDRVKHWVTLNEPYQFTFDGYVQGIMAPGRGATDEAGDPEIEPYSVAYNLLNCHAAAYRLYQEKFKDAQKGVVGITLNVNYYKPSDPTKAEDKKAVEYAYDFTLGWFLEPLRSGDWPENMKKFATLPTAKKPKGRVLPHFLEDQRHKLIHSYDFLGINYYTAAYARKPDQNPLKPIDPGYATDCQYQAKGENAQGDIGEKAFRTSWVYLCADELAELLLYVKQTYNVQKYFVITENGAPEENDHTKTYEQVKDDKYRLKYLKKHLQAIKKANCKGVNVMGYFAWSFMDSYEWHSGYSTRFGMIYVDYNNNLQRYPKNSAIWFKKFLSEKLILGKSSLKRTLIDDHEEEQFENGQMNGTTTMEEEAFDNVEEQENDVVRKLKMAKA
uniref:beta-glucosidase 24-like n=1 Tax=Erigeron canadensis TaxID=72917 RepID=UPI001CB9B0FD|nr:beta-glucosidase 24-like [Erigeron canadensis]